MYYMKIMVEVDKDNNCETVKYFIRFWSLFDKAKKTYNILNKLESQTEYTPINENVNLVCN
jgi:hypothetical protein